MGIGELVDPHRTYGPELPNADPPVQQGPVPVRDRGDDVARAHDREDMVDRRVVLPVPVEEHERRRHHERADEEGHRHADDPRTAPHGFHRHPDGEAWCPCRHGDRTIDEERDEDADQRGGDDGQHATAEHDAAEHPIRRDDHDDAGDDDRQHEQHRAVLARDLCRHRVPDRAEGGAGDPRRMRRAGLRQEGRSPHDRPEREGTSDAGSPSPRAAILTEPCDGEEARSQEEAGDMVEHADQHESTRGGRMPAPRLSDPGFGQDRAGHAEQLEQGVHARLAPVHDLERADGHHRNRDDTGDTARPHPPCEQRERSRAERQRWQAHDQIAGAGARERDSKQVVEGRMRV